MPRAATNQTSLVIDPLRCVEAVEIAYQPIVSTTSLRAHGFEALARLPAGNAFAKIIDLLDAASLDGTLRLAERSLLTKAITKFSQYSGASEGRLFCNVDNRVFDDELTSPEVIVDLARTSGLQPANICIELSERQPPESADALARLVDVFLKHNVRIAIDDFGQGFSGLDTLMRVNPHYLKIDQAFIQGIAQSTRQQAIVSKVIGLAHSLGYLVVGEGVENESDFRTIRELGCDLAQGYLIARPDLALSGLRSFYGNVITTDVRTAAIPRQIAEMICDVDPLILGDSVAKAVDRFKNGSAIDFVPIVDRHGYVHGAVYESDLRRHMFGDYGAALMANKGIEQRLDPFVRRCPISEGNAPTEALINSYVVSAACDGLVLTLDGKYAGVLRNNAILRLAAEREVANARDQNPLTFLPGNNSINRHLSEVLISSHDRTLVFFDFDHFKAFNDNYGFAVGDRALLMFGDLLMKLRHAHEAFVGHIGGDDFFLSLPSAELETAAIVRNIAQKFREDVESLYLLDDRARGGLWAKDRFGETRFLPLLRASAAILTLPASRTHITISEIVAALAGGKSQAKKSDDGIAVVSLPPTAVEQRIAHLSERLVEASPT